MVPLVKSKSGDLSDVDNYRAIALSNAITKLFETVISGHINDHLARSDLQFGFKEKHSTTICTFAMKQTVEYYTSRGGHVFACFVDFSKAFDSVNYWKLFNMLLSDGVHSGIVMLLAFWYSNQSINVRWQNVVSNHFNVSNGTKQGGLLSPTLFNRYINDLLIAVCNSRIGCNIGGVFTNTFAYADDIILLTPSWHAMQSLLAILESCVAAIDMTCNTKKTVCMVFPPKRKSAIVAKIFPPLNLCGADLLFVNSFKYLGHIIDNTLNDADDIQREIRNMFMRTNILLRRFNHCSLAVKIMLFKSYCICIYGSALWMNHTASAIARLKSCYHRCIKNFFCYKKNHSMTTILFDLKLPSFDTLLHNSRYVLHWQLADCTNNIISAYSNRSFSYKQIL